MQLANMKTKSESEHVDLPGILRQNVTFEVRLLNSYLIVIVVNGERPHAKDFKII